MQIIINNSSMQPIYEQIVEQVRRFIMEGILVEEMPLPSVRVLSKELKISALTVKKAYDTLEEQGFVITVHGKGSYIARTNPELKKEERRREVEELFETAIRRGRNSGISSTEMCELFQMIMEEE
jgi:GntR family transcriptional regulator